MPKSHVDTVVDGQKIKLSNLGKIIFPTIGVTKAEVIQYYLDIAQKFLLYSKEKPLTLLRCPNGILEESFMAKKKPDWTPEWIKTVAVEHSTKQFDYLFAHNRASMVWLANMASIELHPMSTKYKKPNYPTEFVFDLDPGNNVSFSDIKDVAQLLNDFLLNENYTSFPKTSGSRGIHIFIPLDGKAKTEKILDKFITIANRFKKAFPSLVTTSRAKDQREGKIYLDLQSNHPKHTVVAPFSLRAKEGAPISMPLNWDLLEQTGSARHYTITNYRSFLEKNPTIWASYFDIKQSVPVKKVIKKKSPANSRYDHMLTEASKTVPKGNYSYEIKWDGIRVMVYIEGDIITLFSKSGRDITKQFPELTLSKSLAVKQGVFDGEIVSLSERGAPDFHAVLGRVNMQNEGQIRRLSQTNPVTCYLFDCLALNGFDITDNNLRLRQKHLDTIISKGKNYRKSGIFRDGEALWEAAKKQKLEGIMAKHLLSTYQPGKRSKDWIKIKFRSTVDCLIVGYTKGEGSRSSLFGSLHILQEINGIKTYRGKVGTGFDDKLMKELLRYFKSYITPDKPFSYKTDDDATSVWLRPLLTCEVSYASLTPNNTFREPVFIKLKL